MIVKEESRIYNNYTGNTFVDASSWVISELDKKYIPQELREEDVVALLQYSCNSLFSFLRELKINQMGYKHYSVGLWTEKVLSESGTNIVKGRNRNPSSIIVLAIFGRKILKYYKIRKNQLGSILFKR